jgi:hypothetical protein
VFQSNGSTLATIASDAAGTAQANPFTAATAVAKFFALPGVYVIRAFKDGLTQEFRDEEIGAKNYRDDQGSLGGTIATLSDLTLDNSIYAEGGAFRFTQTSVGKPAFMSLGCSLAVPFDAVPASFLIGSGNRTNGSRAAFFGFRSGLGVAPAWLELWDKGANPVQANLADNTAGALLTPGSFGWGGVGSTPQVTNLGGDVDRIDFPAGVYRVQPVDIGLKPENTTGYIFIDTKYNTNTGVRIALTHAGPEAGQMHSIAYASGVFSANGWRMQYDNRNILKPVVWDGSKNTGGLLESGSNVNGSFFKYADGRLECFRKRSGVTLTAGVDEVFTWTFPASFIDTNYYVSSTTLNGGNAAFTTNKNSASNSTATSSAMRTRADITQPYDLVYCALGRWR